VSQGARSYRPADELRGLDSELERLRAQVLVSWRQEARLLRWLGLQDGMRVLELGCGAGDVTEALLDLVPQARVTALDADPAMLERARGRLAGDGRVQLVEARAESTGLPEGSFDFVLARYLFQHLPVPEAVALEARRVLRPGGRLAVVDHDAALWGIVAPTFPEVQPIYAKTGRAQAARGGDRLVGRKLWRILRAAGFESVELEAFVYHSDALGLDAFAPQMDPDRMLTFVREGSITADEHARVEEAYRRFRATPGAYVLMIGLMACGERPAS
jgi:ubiquinone/menaquinone biosynthesis C-methylase UbiE